jgi:hypothetical protein
MGFRCDASRSPTRLCPIRGPERAGGSGCDGGYGRQWGVPLNFSSRRPLARSPHLDQTPPYLLKNEIIFSTSSSLGSLSSDPPGLSSTLAPAARSAPKSDLPRGSSKDRSRNGLGEVSLEEAAKRFAAEARRQRGRTELFALFSRLYATGLLPRGLHPLAVAAASICRLPAIKKARKLR